MASDFTKAERQYYAEQAEEAIRELKRAQRICYGCMTEYAGDAVVCVGCGSEDTARVEDHLADLAERHDPRDGWPRETTTREQADAAHREADPHCTCNDCIHDHFEPTS